MKASELIKALSNLIRDHGDLNVFSRADYSYVERIIYEEDFEWDIKEPVFILDQYK